MQKLQAETPFANTNLNGEVMEESQERLAQAMGSLTLAAAGTGVAEDLAALFLARKQLVISDFSGVK